MNMLRQNPKGGPKLKGFPRTMDWKKKESGYQIGYCSKCHEHQVVSESVIMEMYLHFKFISPRKKRFWDYIRQDKMLIHESFDIIVP